jgi:Holliday junction resolvase RusA-like endonuclease
MPTITLEIPRVPPSINELSGYGWRARHRVSKVWQQEVWAAVTNGRFHFTQNLPFPRAKVAIHRISRGRMDPDNLVGCMKPVIDALRYARVLVDDSPDHIELTVTQSREYKTPPCTTICIEPLETP